ncbi:protein translocase subunit SecDF [Carboxylicivirga mesophila]|uniref:Multifunctional fusion protein n=1 Tax=Carboxylicivirga mesophila TaxID=1166478 RepID=A0ABS5KGY6_9BACT|nr:protein translocase subunit SecDF [Carboxylicivirga mesophila]MBS2213528.1 protein translocase subunit SecDF [Carboxylicivirga mesophila]
MQNKGAIRLFAILLVLVSLYQLMFTFQTRRVENVAKEIAGGDSDKEFAYLDSIKNETVYNFLWGARKYTYQECKEREINFGLDLKGGMNLILEVKVADVVRALSNYNTDETFLRALKEAEEAEKNSSDDFIKLFGKAFSDIDPNAQLATIFNTVELKERVSYNSTNEEVLKVIREESNSAIDNAFNILRSRIDRFGVTQPNIQRLEKAGRVLVELPGVTDPQRVRKLLQGTASLEFWETYENSELFESLVQADSKVREIEAAKAPVSATEEEAEEVSAETAEEASLVDQLAADATTTDSLEAASTKSLFSYLQPNHPQQRGPVVGIALSRDTAEVNAYLANPTVKSLFPKDARFFWTVKPIEKDYLVSRFGSDINEKETAFQLVAIKVSTHDGRPPLEGDVITSARSQTNQRGQFEVSMSMNAEGAKTWSRLTGANVDRSIAVVLDGFVYSFPTVNQKIDGGQSQITGNFTPEESQDLANILKSGKLPAPARIVEDTVVGPSLGQEAVDSGLTSFIWAFVVVLIYMLLYYGVRSGWVADFALIANMFFIMGVLASFGAVLTLPGIAGIVLTIGMSVDANVLIYERIKEELRAGKGIQMAIKDGYNNAFSAIIDANVTTFLTGLILFLFGTGPIKGFATTLMIGIATSFFSAIFITRLIFEQMLSKNKKLVFDTKLTRNLYKNLHVRFLEKQKLFFVISAIAVLASIGSLATLGLKQGIDFTGGRTFVVRFDEQVSSVDVQKTLTDVFDGAHVEAKQFGNEGNQVRIATNYMIEENSDEIDNQVETKLYEGLKTFIKKDISQDDFLSDYRMSSQKVGPTIASDIKKNAAYAIGFSLLVIFLYILIRFRNKEYGYGALAALVHDVIIVLGIFSLTYSFMPFSMEIDQSFIAAILTVIGYSINDTVVVFDRIREYFKLFPKRNKEEVVDAALNSTVSRTINTSLTTFVVLLVIFLFGGEVIRGFVFALMVGVLVGTYSSLFIATPVAFNFLNKKKQKK